MADFSDADVQSLAQKLTQFKETLTQGEQVAMAAVIQRGMPQTEDVQGYILTSKDVLGPVLTVFVLPKYGEEGRGAR